MNRSYCRFHNTHLALKDCRESLDEDLSENDAEKLAKNRLISEWQLWLLALRGDNFRWASTLGAHL